jgi:hypothetical protein
MSDIDNITFVIENENGEQSIIENPEEYPVEEVLVEPTQEVVVVEPIQEVVVEQTQEVVVEPIQEVVVEQTQEVVVEPAQEVVVEPAQEVVVEPIQEVVVEQTQEVVVEQTQEVVVEPIQEVVVEQTQKVVVEPIQEVVVEPIQEVVVEPIQEVVVEPIQEVVVEPIQEVVVEPIQEVVVEPIQEVVVEPIQEVVVEPIQEVVVEPIQHNIIFEQEEVVVESVEQIKAVQEEAVKEETIEPIQEIFEEEIIEPNITFEEDMTLDITTTSIPKIIFIVPYRDRKEQQRFFSFHMKKIMEDYKKTDYKIIYSHQNDNREFNRGAMKNIGFLYAKSLYPNDYQNITFVFNDVDTMPYNKNFLNYETEKRKVKHFYGYTFALGGIVSMTGADFEKINGFPNYWAWGYEDNALHNRVNIEGLTIDRSKFYPILDKNILQLKDGITRIVNRGEFNRYADEYKYKNNIDGLNKLSNISYTFDDNTSFLNIFTFDTPIIQNPELTQIYDIRNGNTPFIPKKPFRRGGSMRMVME